jgi:secreted trypsin-like serine protease
VSRRPALMLVLLVIATIVSTLVATVSPDSGEAARRNRRDIQPEVVRGIAVPDGKYPFVAAIGSADAFGNLKRQFCGGSLIAPSHVLTAAHCVVGTKVESIAVVVGQAAFGSGQGETRTLAAIMIHPAYNKRNLNSDVAVLKLSAPILSIEPAAVVGVNDGSFEWGGTGLTVVGWGNTVRSNLHWNKIRYPDRLKEGAISVVSDANCARKWHKIGFSRKKFASTLLVCTTARRFGVGDSGSPVFGTSGGSFVQVSLVSGGFVGSKKISDFGPQLSAPSIAEFITSSIAA